MIDGRPRVILFTRRSINKGESLQYDYNAGGKRLFPTEDFIWFMNVYHFKLDNSTQQIT